MPPRALAFLILSALLAGACVSAGPPPGPEAPAPASEARATLRLRVDLVRGQRCEEAFDLALYEDRGVELIEWDPGPRCEERAIAVRYLPGRTSPENILRAVQKTGAKITQSSQIQGAPR